MPSTRPAHYGDLLERIIDEGIAAAVKDYAEEQPKLAGSIAGFDACRGREVNQLAELLREARERSAELRLTHPEDHREAVDAYWYARCYELEVEWVCNVISALLLNAGMEVIIQPTARGVMKAASIVGVSDELFDHP